MTFGRPLASSPDDTLAVRSVEVLKAGQASSGAFVACPTFPKYRYAWLRDGAFCAYALDVVGERDDAGAFHRWTASTIEAQRRVVEHAVTKCMHGEPLSPEETPPARYTLNGDRERDVDEPWPNFQIDGYGMWLWALEFHLGGSRPDTQLARTVRLVAEYLAQCWQLKCFGCWEEFDDGEHATTLAAVAAGLRAAAQLLDDSSFSDAATRVMARLLEAHTTDGRFRRGPADDRVDGGLAWLAVPFRVMPPHDPRVVETVRRIYLDLVGPGGGVYRYCGDTYYGGGQWLLLTSSLAWHERVSGNESTARELQQWVRAQALPNGDLAEQVTTHSQDARMIEPWVRRWGNVATPLLWSHAMYLLAETAHS
jgi:isomaltose glucohydrolase